MQMSRLPDSLRVFEHEPVPVSVGGVSSTGKLTESEAELLLRINDARPGFCQRGFLEVRFSQYCGIVRLPNRILEVLPKIANGSPAGELRDDEARRSRQVLLGMLRAVPGFPIFQVGTAEQSDARMPLLEIFISHFLKEVLAEVKRGLLTRYMAEEENLHVLRGRIQTPEHARFNHHRPDRFYCAFDELTADNGYNRAIRFTLAMVRSWIVSESLQQLWLELWAIFAEIGNEAYTASKVAQLPRHRLVRRYEGILQWCEWILNLQTPSLLQGRNQAPALLFDMNRLFESYVAVCKRRDYPPPIFSVKVQGPQLQLARSQDSSLRDSFPLRPDVTVMDNASKKPVVIYDAKWKIVEKGVSERDVYQMLAYAVAFRCMDIRLVYPWIEGAYQPAEDGTLEVFKILLPAVGQHEVSVSVQVLKDDMEVLQLFQNP
jgi:5-methylcytosine-specific restriction enzyme subunit McrC